MTVIHTSNKSYVLSLQTPRILGITMDIHHLPNLLVLQPLHLHLMIWCNKHGKANTILEVPESSKDLKFEPLEPPKKL